MCQVSLPDQLNAAGVFVDRHIREGRSEKAAILFEDAVVTYRDLFHGVNRVGNALLALDVRMEERVVILMPDTPELVFSFFGAIKIGAVAILANTMLKPADYQYLLDDSRARVLIVHDLLLPRIEAIRDSLKYLKHLIVVGEDSHGNPRLEALMADASPELEAAETSKDDAAFWIYSSGTTGFPKGAIHLQHDMIVEAEYYGKQTVGVEESDTSFSVAKLFFAFGLGNALYFPLYTGGTTVLLPDRPVPQKVFEVIDRYQPTVFYSVPTSYAALLQEAENTGRTSLGRVRMCVSAGEPLPAAIFQRWKERFGFEIYDGIGSTEILHIYISNRPGHVKPGATGQIVPGYEARIVDDEFHDVPAGEVGTLLIKGDSIANGYWNKHQQNKDTFLGEWINTRDKFRLDEDGFFWYSGRTDDMMKVSGQAVWPADVESLLLGHPAVLESGVVGFNDGQGLLKPRAYVVLKDGYEASAELVREIQTFVKQNTSPHKYPRSIIFIDELPKTASGKIQRYKLRQRSEAGGQAATQPPAPMPGVLAQSD